MSQLNWLSKKYFASNFKLIIRFFFVFCRMTALVTEVNFWHFSTNHQLLKNQPYFTKYLSRLTFSNLHFFHAFSEKTRKNYLKWKNKQNPKTGKQTTSNLELTRNTDAGGWSLERPFICYFPIYDLLLTFRHKMTFNNEVDKNFFFKFSEKFNFSTK